jgi:hypothetical protein
VEQTFLSVFCVLRQRSGKVPGTACRATTK